MSSTVHENEPLDGAPDALTGGLLPVVIHRLNNATQLLANFQALLGLGGADDLLRSRADDLADTSRTVHELGYVLAVLASASGADLLLERREARGLEWMRDSVREGLRREGRDLGGPAGALPLASPAVGEGWEWCWAFGSLLHAAGLATPADEPLAWSIHRDGEAWCVDVRGVRCAGLPDVVAAIRCRLPDALVTDHQDGLRLAFPADWFRDAAVAEVAPA